MNSPLLSPFILYLFSINPWPVSVLTEIILQSMSKRNREKNFIIQRNQEKLESRNEKLRKRKKERCREDSGEMIIASSPSPPPPVTSSGIL